MDGQRTQTFDFSDFVTVIPANAELATLAWADPLPADALILGFSAEITTPFQAATILSVYAGAPDRVPPQTIVQNIAADVAGQFSGPPAGNFYDFSTLADRQLYATLANGPYPTYTAGAVTVTVYFSTPVAGPSSGTLLTVSQARQHVETDLGDDALQRLIDDADALIVERCGPHDGPFTESIYSGVGPLLFTPRRALTITSIREYAGEDDVTGTLLDPTDYRVELGGRVIRRLSTGPNSAGSWGHRTTIIYSPTSEIARRTRVEIDLVRLAAQYEAKSSESIGDYSASHVEYERERDRLVSSLRSPLSFA